MPGWVTCHVHVTKLREDAARRRGKAMQKGRVEETIGASWQPHQNLALRNFSYQPTLNLPPPGHGWRRSRAALVVPR